MKLYFTSCAGDGVHTSNTRQIANVVCKAKAFAFELQNITYLLLYLAISFGILNRSWHSIATTAWAFHFLHRFIDSFLHAEGVCSLAWREFIEALEMSG